MNTAVRLTELAKRYGPWLLAALFVVGTFVLQNRQHSAYNTLVYDFARFAQAIWYTLHGRFLFETIKYGSILGNHFSPIMALASPLVAVAGTERVLFLIQSVNVAATGLILHRLFLAKHPRHPVIALGFLLAWFLNPAVYDITLSEVRRVVFGMPFLALGLYGLATERYGRMLLGLSIALLAKESISLPVAMIGVYLLAVRGRWRWGLGVMALGVSWFLGISLWLIPSLGPPQRDTLVYPQLYYFDNLGGSYGEIIGTILASPLAFVQQILGPIQLRAVVRILLPLGFVLPFLAPAWTAICVPFTVLMFASRSPVLAGLNRWYSATIVPVLFAAIAVGWRRLPGHLAHYGMAVLLVAACAGYLLFGQAPGGARYDPELYDVTSHDRVAKDAIAAVPRRARVAAQYPYAPHLTLRRDLYHYPWIEIGEEAIEVFVLDRNANAYPLNIREINETITNMVANPDFVVLAEADGLFVLSRAAEAWPAYETNALVDDTMLLERVEVAVADREGMYLTTISNPLVLGAGDSVRVSLYWMAVDAPGAERTVSVRIPNAANACVGGALAAQHDGIPGETTKPTSWWEPGWQVRDVHYLRVSDTAAAGQARLDVLLYDTYSQDVVPIQASDGSIASALTVVPVQLE